MTQTERRHGKAPHDITHNERVQLILQILTNGTIAVLCILAATWLAGF